MRKFLRKLRRGFKTACLTTALVTCWNIGTASSVLADIVTLKFSGTVSPAVNDISHLYLIYGTGYSGFSLTSAEKLGDFQAGETISFSVFSNTEEQESIGWYVAGLYGDISNNLYDPNINGVTLMGNDSYVSEGTSWNILTSYDEETIFNYLLNDDIQNFPFDNMYSYKLGHFEYLCDLETSSTNKLYDFTEATLNGEIYIQSEVVPEPASLILFGTGGYIILRFRNRNKD